MKKILLIMVTVLSLTVLSGCFTEKSETTYSSISGELYPCLEIEFND